MKNDIEKKKKEKKGKYEPGGFKLLVKRSSAGLGLFAGEAIPKGACIIEYVGRVISEEEKYKSRSKYLFEVNPKKTIDGSARTNLARYLNHSCKPNCEINIYKERIFFNADKNINSGEELTIDYGKEYWDDHIKPKGCKCASCLKKKESAQS
jgi:SET domain-containing protein